MRATVGKAILAALTEGYKISTRVRGISIVVIGLCIGAAGIFYLSFGDFDRALQRFS